MVSEHVLSMRPVPLALGPAREGVRRGRSLAVLAVAALLVHAALLGGLQWTWPDTAVRLPALEVRTLGAAATATPRPEVTPPPTLAVVGDEIGRAHV